MNRPQHHHPVGHQTHRFAIATGLEGASRPATAPSRSSHRFRTPDQHVEKPSLFREMTTVARHRRATYAQFCLDVGRLHLDIDGDTVSRVDANAVYTHLLNLFVDESVGLWFAYWCTQTALASAYYQQLKRLNHMQSPSGDQASPCTTDAAPFRANADVVYHLLDDGRQTIHIHTHSCDDKRLFAQCGCTTHGSNWMFPDTVDANDIPGGWVLARVPGDSAVLHIQKPFRVIRQRGFDAHHTPVCRYILHVWVCGSKDVLGSYRVAWQQVSV